MQPVWLCLLNQSINQSIRPRGSPARSWGLRAPKSLVEYICYIFSCSKSVHFGMSFYGGFHWYMQKKFGRAKSFLGGNTFSRFLIPQWMAMLNTPLEIDNHKIWQTYVYQTQVNLGPDLWVRMTVRHWCLVPPDDQTNPNCATWWPNIQLINIQLINTSGAIWWSIVQLMQVVPSGGQICNWCKWCHLVVKFATNTSGTIWLPNLQLMQVTESISGSVVPLAMFSILLWMHTWLSLNFHCCNQFWQIYIYLEGMGLQYPARVEIPCCG